MARKIWTGSINFGLVTIPVGLYGATQEHGFQFHQYERGTTDRVRYKRVNERTGEEVEYQDIVKGREVNGVLVTVEPSELDAVAPGRSRTIDITRFVDLDEIDPVYFQKTYWLAPNSKENQRPYDLLRQAMDQTNQVGIATFVLRGKEYLTAVRADESALALNTLFFADEIRSPEDVLGSTGETAQPSENELRMASMVIESMSGEWQPEEYTDTYTERVEQLIEDKSQGQEPSAEPAPDTGGVIDLTEALRRSVDEARQNRAPSSGAKRSSRDQQQQLSELSKADLNQQAKELNIRGRTRMKRADLETAVAEARATAGTGRSRRAS